MSTAKSPNELIIYLENVDLMKIDTYFDIRRECTLTLQTINERHLTAPTIREIRRLCRELLNKTEMPYGPLSVRDLLEAYLREFVLAFNTQLTFLKEMAIEDVKP
jgi:hypothetical protein